MGNLAGILSSFPELNDHGHRIGSGNNVINDQPIVWLLMRNKVNLLLRKRLPQVVG